MKNILTLHALNTEMKCLLVPVVLLLECISMLIKPPFTQATVYLVGERTILTTEINYAAALQTFHSLYCTAYNHYTARRPL